MKLLALVALTFGLICCQGGSSKSSGSRKGTTKKETKTETETDVEVDGEKLVALNLAAIADLPESQVTWRFVTLHDGGVYLLSSNNSLWRYDGKWQQTPPPQAKPGESLIPMPDQHQWLIVEQGLGLYANQQMIVSGQWPNQYTYQADAPSRSLFTLHQVLIPLDNEIVWLVRKQAQILPLSVTRQEGSLMGVCHVQNACIWQWKGQRLYISRFSQNEIIESETKIEKSDYEAVFLPIGSNDDVEGAVFAVKEGKLYSNMNQSPSAQQTSSEPTWEGQVSSLNGKYCIRCHSADLPDETSWRQKAADIVRRVDTSAVGQVFSMPPGGTPEIKSISETERNLMIQFLKSSI